MTPRETGPRPLVTISLVTYQGMRWLPGCLASLRSQDLADYELLAIDNASGDGTLGLLRAAAEGDDRITVIASEENLGFARAHNRTIAAARGEYVLLLNQDVELDPSFLTAAVREFHDRPTLGSVQGRLRRLGPVGERTTVLDTTGLEMHRDRRVVSRAQGEIDESRFQVPGEIFGADGPAPVYRRSALVDARLPRRGGGWEVLDEDFFMYKEDVDLAWRLALLGWSAWYAPDALGWHARGAGGPVAYSVVDIARTNRTLPGWIKVLSWRNHRLMQIKNESLSGYLSDLPWIARRELLSIGYILVADPRQLRAVPQLLMAMPAAMRKRRWLGRRLRSRRPT